MALITHAAAEVFATHGSTFASYVRPSLGSDSLCAWRVDVPPEVQGARHRPSREEVIYCLEGELAITLDGSHHHMHAGDVAYVPAGSAIQLDGGPKGGAALAISVAGLEATMSDGSRFHPPWTM